MRRAGSRRRILVEAAVLFSDGAADPHPVAGACLALERLSWLGEPVILVGRELAGRRLPDDLQDRLDWVRASLGGPERLIVAIDDGADPDDGDQPDPTEPWAGLQAKWDADTLVTSRQSSVASGRRAGLTVVSIGPRGPAANPTMPRADIEALDLLDAARQLIAADTFDGLAEVEPDVDPALVSVVRQSPADSADMLERGQPGDR